jgi:hypothetical protein
MARMPCNLHGMLRAPGCNRKRAGGGAEKQIICRIRRNAAESVLKCRPCEKHVKTLLY